MDVGNVGENGTGKNGTGKNGTGKNGTGKKASSSAQEKMARMFQYTISTMTKTINIKGKID